ncbi:MAG: FliM/FliN family flagellar motor switch protein [Deltaproteobacteria bacterium]|nr:FliM/FliN family flagellar motor switch protein [Deltaproteobacteria bacterium]
MAAYVHEPGTAVRELDFSRLAKVTRRQASVLRELGRLAGPLPVGTLWVSLQNLGTWTVVPRSVEVLVANEVRERLDAMAVVFRLESVDGAELLVALDAHLVVAVCAAAAGQPAPPAVARRATESESAVVGVVVASLVSEALSGAWHLVGTERNPGVILDASPGRHAFSTLTANVGVGDGWGRAFVAAAFGQPRTLNMELPNRLVERLEGMVLSALLRTGRFVLAESDVTGLSPGAVVLVGEAGMVLDVGRGGFACVGAGGGLDPIWNGLTNLEIVGGFMDHRDESGGFERSGEFGAGEMESGPVGSTGSTGSSDFSGALGANGGTGSSQFGAEPGEPRDPREGYGGGGAVGGAGDVSGGPDGGRAGVPVQAGSGGPSGVALDGMMLDGVVEMGRLQLSVTDLATLLPGAIVELDRPVGSKVVLRVGGKVVARGGLVDVEGVLGFRVEELV